MMQTKEKNKVYYLSGIDLLALASLFSLLFLRGTFFGDPGVGWHLKTGEWIIEHGKIPFHDPFLFTSDGKQWVSNQWLSDVLFWFIYELGSWPLLHFVSLSICLAVPFLVLYPKLRRLSNESGIAPLVVIALVSSMLSIQWFFRPVIVSFLLFSIVVVLVHNVASDNKSPKSLFRLPVLFCFWANLHPAFILGLACLALAAMSGVILDIWQARRISSVSKQILVVAIACAIAALINPYGVDVYKDMFSLIGSDYFMRLNKEWLPPNFTVSIFRPFWISLLLLLLSLIGFRKLKWHLFEILCLALFTYMAISSRRYIPFFAIIASLPLVKGVSVLIGAEGVFKRLSRLNILFPFLTRSSRFYSFIVWAFSFVFVIFSGYFPGKSSEYSEPSRIFYPVNAVNYLKQNGFQSPLFHGPDWGGYLIFSFFPSERMFIDDRNQLSGVRLYEEFFTMYYARDGWENLFDTYGFKTLLLNKNKEGNYPLRSYLEKNGHWQLVYDDYQAVIWKKVLE